MPTLTARIESQIAEQIISGRFPPGTRLDERSLAEELNVSRTPVREALRQLAHRGLTQILPMRGVVVSQISIKEIAELLQANCELEGICARLSATTMTAMEKTELDYVFHQCKELAETGNLADYLVANKTFHQLIIEGSHNTVLAQLVSDVRDRLSLYRQYHPQDENRLQNSTDAHQHIVDAILTGDAEQAYLSMCAHNTQLGSAALRALRQSQDKTSGRADSSLAPSVRKLNAARKSSRSTGKAKPVPAANENTASDPQDAPKRRRGQRALT